MSFWKNLLRDRKQSTAVASARPQRSSPLQQGSPPRKRIVADSDFRHAVSSGFVAVVQDLLNQGADCNSKNFVGMTPLHEAAVKGYKDIVEVLLAQGADINATDQLGHTPLFNAEFKGHTEVAELLRQQGGHK